LKQNIQCCPPPSRLRLAGNVTDASLSPRDAFPPATTRGIKGAKAAGIRYERKAQSHLCAKYPLTYVQGPWLTYRTLGHPRPYYCQPDGLFVDFERGVVTIVEIKIKHTATAWWQLRRLYEPVLRNLLGPDLWEFSFLEIVRWYDPHVAFPQEHSLMRDPSRLNPGAFGVHIWSGRAA